MKVQTLPAEPQIVLTLSMEEAKRLWILSYQKEFGNPNSERFHRALGPILKAHGVNEVLDDTGNKVYPS